MYTLLTVLVYTAAVAIPAYLLHRFRSQAWYWHVLAIVASVSLGLVPIPAELQKRSFDLVFGFAFIALLAWGGGGLIVFHPHGSHRHKHA